MASLFPAFPEIEIVEADDAIVDTYSASYQFNAVKGEFATDGAGRVMVCNGYEAWKGWCMKVIRTERDAYLSYSTNIGVELERALKQDNTDAAKLMLEKTVTEALMVHPSTQSVGDFFYSLSGDALHVSFIVKGKSVPAFTATLNVVAP